MKQSRQLLASILCVCLLLLSATACSPEPVEDYHAETTQSADTQSTATEPVTEAPTTADPLDYLPDTKFNDAEVRILDVDDKGPHGSYWKTRDVYSEEINGETINDAVWKRRVQIEERFGVKFVEHQVGKIPDTVNNSILAQNDEYDIIVSRPQDATAMINKSYLLDLQTEVPYLDLSKDWWDQNALAGCSIANRVYFATGDILLTDNDATFSLLFNKEMAKDHGFTESFYDLVNEGKWTFDKMYDVMTAVVSDLNGDNKITWEADRLGLTSGSISVEALFYASGLRQIKKDNDDFPVLSLDVDKVSSFIEKCYKICVDPEVCYNYTVLKGNATTVKSVFTEGRALFYGETLDGVSRLRDSEIDFGVIPYPKYDEAQERYYSFVHSVGTVVSVPISNTHLEMTGIVLDAMAAYGQKLMTPAYYDITLIAKGLRDTESEPMIELILDNRIYDLGYIYNWGNYTSTIRNMTVAGHGGAASAIKKSEKLFNRALETTLEAIGLK